MEPTILNYCENTPSKQFIKEAIYIDGTLACRSTINYLFQGRIYKSVVETTIKKGREEITYDGGEKYDEVLASIAISPKTVRKYCNDLKNQLRNSSNPERAAYKVVQINGNNLESQYYKELDKIFFSKKFVNKTAIDRMHEFANAFYYVQSELLLHDQQKKSVQPSNHRIIDITNELMDHFNNRNLKYFN